MEKQIKTIQFSQDGDTYSPLPIVDTNDNDKVLMVVDGEWTAVELEHAEDLSF